MSKNRSESPKLSRRDLLTSTVLLGSGALVAGCDRARIMGWGGEVGDYDLNNPENIINTVCLQCNTGCGIKVKFHDGVASKIDGNPLAPQCLYPHLPANTSPWDMAGIDGAICPKGQAGLQSVYDPYRIRKVLKRAGKRGENKWESIEFDQAVTEIVRGGKLFSKVPGEENRHVEGLDEIMALKDPAVAKSLASDITALTRKIRNLRKANGVDADVTHLVEEFKAKHRDHLDVLIDPDHPDLGPKNNQLVFNWGRLKHGRSDFIKRFVNDSFGSTNTHGHTTVCQGSLYFTGQAMIQQFGYDKAFQKADWIGTKHLYWQADTGNCEFILFIGASPFEGNYGPPGRTPRIVNNIKSGKMKIAVADPRFSKTAAKAWKWLPIKPGHECAFTHAMMRWIIENKRYDAKYLSCANKAAADESGEPTWCNASWLVKIGADGKPGALLRGHEIGLGAPERRTEGDVEYDYPSFVVLQSGVAKAFDTNDKTNPVYGDVLATKTFTGTDGKTFTAKTACQVLLESTQEHTIEEWADICGLKADDIVEVARELTSHGKKACVDSHRGVSQHTNGYYNVLSAFSISLLIGNYDWKGGFIKKHSWNEDGTKYGGQPFQWKSTHDGKMKKMGISIIRHLVRYEDTTLFEGYPAKRPFYPLATDIYQEIIPSMGDGYPYPCKCLITYMGSPVYALPAGDKLIPILTDTKKIPLYIASDIVVGETSMYADYIFPDLSYLERWEFQGSHPSFANKIAPVRQPAVSPIPEEVTVFGERQPISLESMLMAFAEKLGSSGFGPDALGPGMDLTRQEHLYLKIVANIAAGEKEGQMLPDASKEEMALFEKARRHLPPSVYDVNVWKAAVGEKVWPKVVYVLNRGGRWEDFEDGYDGELVAHRHGKFLNFYAENTASVKNSMSGKSFSGVAIYEQPMQDSAGNVIVEDPKYNMKLLTYREITATKSRTAGNYWLSAILPENSLLINAKDAGKLGISDGDLVKVTSPSNPEGFWDLANGQVVPLHIKAKVMQGMRPGNVSFALGFGHWAYGAADIEIDGQTVKGDARRSRGCHLNAANRVDPILKNVSLTDHIGASVAFYDSMVKVARV